MTKFKPFSETFVVFRYSSLQYKTTGLATPLMPEQDFPIKPEQYNIRSAWTNTM